LSLLFHESQSLMTSVTSTLTENQNNNTMIVKQSPMSLKALLSSLPQPYPGDLREQTRNLLQNSNGKIPILVALDDDPTGTQTCHGVTVLTVWDVPTLVTELKATPPGGGFFILTNSRALGPSAARELIKTICKNLKEAAEKIDTKIEVVLRGDSTLRGHFPDEPEAVDEVLGAAHSWILAPFFLQGGRYTINDVHYVLEGEDLLVPAGETPFAKDATFGYKSSNLRDWIVEKTDGHISQDRIASISIPNIRTGGPEAVKSQLQALKKGSVVVVNAACEQDMDVVVLGLLQGNAFKSTLSRISLTIFQLLLKVKGFFSGQALPLYQRALGYLPSRQYPLWNSTRHWTLPNHQPPVGSS
jgi:hypothetical protein